MKKFLLLLLCLSNVMLFAQKKERLSQGYFNLGYNYNYHREGNGLNLSRTSPAFSFIWRFNDPLLLNLGVSQISFHQKETENNTTTHGYFGLNATLDWLFLSKTKFPLQPFVGVGIYPYSTFSHLAPKVSSIFDYKYSFRGISTGVDAGLVYNFHDRLLISLTNVLQIVDFGIGKTQVANPALSLAQQSNQYFDFKVALEVATLKMGVAYRLY